MSEWPATLQGCIERQVLLERSRQREIKGYDEQIRFGVSDWRWPGMLSDAEAAVFAIDREVWPRCVVALSAFAHFTGEAHLTEYPPEVYETACKTHAYILRADHCSVEAFAEFAHVFCGLSGHDAYAAFWKEEAWHLREGHRLLIRLERASAKSGHPTH